MYTKPNKPLQSDGWYYAPFVLLAGAQTITQSRSIPAAAERSVTFHAYENNEMGFIFDGIFGG